MQGSAVGRVGAQYLRRSSPASGTGSLPSPWALPAGNCPPRSICGFLHCGLPAAGLELSVRRRLKNIPGVRFHSGANERGPRLPRELAAKFDSKLIPGPYLRRSIADTHSGDV